MVLAARGRYAAVAAMAGVVLPCLLFSQSSDPSDVTRELRVLLDADQQEPLPPDLPSDPVKQERVFRAYWEEHFKPRRDRVLALIESGRVQSAEDYEMAGTLLNHSLYPEDQLVAHLMFTGAVFKGRDSARWYAATALDNYLVAVGKPQVFGTLWGSPGRPAQDRSDVLQLPMTDTLRRDFCVPSLARQEALLEALRRGDVAAWRRGKIDCPDASSTPTRR